MWNVETSYLGLVFQAGEPQGTLSGVREEDAERSEGHPVMGWIRVQELPCPKGSRRSAGVSLRESRENHIKEGKQMNTALASVCTFP